MVSFSSGDESEGVTGLKALGVRDLNYKMAFLACSITPTNPKVGFASWIDMFDGVA